MTTRSYEPLTDADFETAYPSSRKVYVDGPQGVRVPMREIAISHGEPPLRVYDTSGPRDMDVQAGLPSPRRDWILARRDVEAAPANARATRRPLRARPGCSPTQLHYARQ